MPHTLTALQDNALTVAARHLHHHAGIAGQWAHIAKTNPGAFVGVIVIIAIVIGIGALITRSN